jgi:hypothetical protein
MKKCVGRQTEDKNNDKDTNKANTALSDGEYYTSSKTQEEKITFLNVKKYTELHKIIMKINGRN